MTAITAIHAREIIDSRANPTVEVDVKLESGAIGRAAVPSGASTGTHEALELRDGALSAKEFKVNAKGIDAKKRYLGKGVLQAVHNVNYEIGPELVGQDATEQVAIDKLMLELDGTETKSKLGANAILAVSLANAKAAAATLGQPLFKYLGGPNAKVLPVPMANVINGGAHSDAPIDFQEFMVMPHGFATFSEGLQAITEIFHALKAVLKKKGLSTAVGDEGGFAPKLESADAALDAIAAAVKDAGYKLGKDIFLALDVAASEFYTGNETYVFKKSSGQKLSGDEMVEFYARLCAKYPIVSIEDGCAEGDWKTWKKLTDKLGSKTQLVGDDLFVTNVKFLRKEVETSDERALPGMLLETLSQLDGEAVVLANGEVPIFTTPGIDQIGLLRDGRIQSPELLATVRVVRRKHSRQTGVIELPRGPIGEGRHELTVNVIPLTENDLVLVLLRDESEAQRVDEVRRDFVANISHELKTPIGALSLLSEAVLGAKNDPAAVEKFATRMQTESKRLTDLVQEIINLSRLQDSDPLSVPSELHIQDLVNEAIDQSQVTADSRHITVSNSEVVDGLILGDREQLIMAIQNLIENAINYSPEGTKVNVTSTVEDGIIDISITDQGIGIPEADLDRIFERFYRVDPARSRQTGGTGLGLSIVKHVALKHGGEVKVWSSENVGSTFSLRLPLYVPTEEISQ